MPAESQTLVQNPVEVPLYTIGDAAHYLRVPLWAVLALSGRFRRWSEPDFFLYHWHRGVPGVGLFDDDPNFPHPENRLSFCALASLFVRTAVFQVLAEGPHGRKDREQWESLYRGVWRGLEDSPREPISFAAGSVEDRVTQLTEPYAARLTDDQLALLRKWFTVLLSRIETQDGVPLRLYPLSRDPAGDAPRTVVLDPRVRFGRPTITNRGVPTDAIFERFRAGDSLAELAEDYALTVAEVEEAIRYEATPPLPLRPYYGW